MHLLNRRNRSAWKPQMAAAAAIAALCLLSPGCAGTPTSPPISPTAGLRPDLEQDLTLREGEAVLTLTASAPGAGWEKKDAEAATVSVYLDGAYRADVVLFRGDESFAYDVLLGPVKSGAHKLAIFLDPAKSAAGAREAKVEVAAVRVYSPGDALYPILANAPMVYGRVDAGTTDTPLISYYEVFTETAGVTYQYTYIFSHEDGGTAPDGLMARWGRLTDIEYLYLVTLDASGKILRAEFQDKDHKVGQYTAARDGGHPVLAVITRNNMVGQSGSSPYRFALAPLQTLLTGSREVVMDRNPWTYAVMAQEWARHGQEGTEKTASPQTREVSDPRNYLYVEFLSRPANAGPCDSKIAIQVKLRGADTVYNSDHLVESLRIQTDSWRRSAIELPPGTTAKQVESLTFSAFPGKDQPGCPLLLKEVRKAFLLGKDYVPGDSLAQWQGEETLKPDAASGAPARFTIQAGGS